MSVVNVKRKAKARAAVRYQIYGVERGGLAAQNEAAGTTRIAAMYSDVISDGDDRVQDAFAFVDRAEALAAAHGRKVQIRSLIQSFEASELDPTNPRDVDRCRDLGYLLAKELHPNSDVLVITHVDGVGGHPHNHISVINHDNETGKALRGNHLHFQVAKVNDRVMAREGARIVERSHERDQRLYWEEQRSADGLSAFDQELGDKIEASLLDSRSVDQESYVAVLQEHGIELDEKKVQVYASEDGKKPAHESVGWTYRMRDTTGEKARTRRRKASSLSDDFTYKGAHAIFMTKAQQVQQQVLTDPGSERMIEHGEARADLAGGHPGSQQQPDIEDQLADIAGVEPARGSARSAAAGAGHRAGDAADDGRYTDLDRSTGDLAAVIGDLRRGLQRQEQARRDREDAEAAARESAAAVRDAAPDASDAARQQAGEPERRRRRQLASELVDGGRAAGRDAGDDGPDLGL